MSKPAELKGINFIYLYFLFYSDQNETLKIPTQPQCRVPFTVVVVGSKHLTDDPEWLKYCDPLFPSFPPAERKGSFQCIVNGSVDPAMSKPAELKGIKHLMIINFI